MAFKYKHSIIKPIQSKYNTLTPKRPLYILNTVFFTYTLYLSDMVTTNKI